MLKLVSLIAGVGASEVRTQFSGLKISVAVGMAVLIFGLTGWAALVAALAFRLSPLYGAQLTAVIIAGLMATLIIIAVVGMALLKTSRAKRVKRQRRSLAQSATTALALGPLIARMNPLAALGLAVGTGVIMSLLVDTKSNDRND